MISLCAVYSYLTMQNVMIYWKTLTNSKMCYATYLLNNIIK